MNDHPQGVNYKYWEDDSFRNLGKIYVSLLDQCGKHIPNASVTHGVLGDPGMVGTMGEVSNYLKVFKV